MKKTLLKLLSDSASARVAFVIAIVTLIQVISATLILKPPPDRVSTQTRLQQLSETLQTASDSIAEIEQEINDTQQLVDDLEKKKTLYEQLITTDREQVEAIALLLTQEQEQQNRRVFWINLAIGFATNLITAIIAIYAEYKVGFFRKWLGAKNP